MRACALIIKTTDWWNGCPAQGFPIAGMCSKNKGIKEQIISKKIIVWVLNWSSTLLSQNQQFKSEILLVWEQVILAWEPETGFISVSLTLNVWDFTAVMLFQHRNPISKWSIWILFYSNLRGILHQVCATKTKEVVMTQIITC